MFLEIENLLKIIINMTKLIDYLSKILTKTFQVVFFNLNSLKFWRERETGLLKI